MKTKSLLSLFTLVLFLFISCKKETLVSNPPNSFELNEERISIVNMYSEMFHEEFGLTVQDFSNNLDNLDNLDNETFTKHFNDRLNKRIDEFSFLKSNETSSYDSIYIDYQPYMDEVSNRLQIDDIDLNKDETINFLCQVINDYIEEVKVLSDINDMEKQLVIEKILLHKGLYLSFLEYGELFNEGSDSGMKCNWWCRRRKEIACTSYTIFTAGMCGLSVAAILTGQIPEGVAVGALCLALIANTIDCWNNI